VFLECPGQVRFNIVYFTIFKAKVWKILIFECILLLEIETNCKNCVWKGKSVKPSMYSHCQISKLNSENVKNKKNVFTLGPMA
jgi:hypothetical protein